MIHHTHHAPPQRPTLAYMRRAFADVQRLNRIDPRVWLVMRRGAAGWGRKKARRTCL